MSEKTPYPTLERIQSPHDLRTMNMEALEDVCEEMRGFLIDTVSKTGGHLSSSLGTVELAVAIHTVFNTPEDRVIWDVGHQAYPHKVLTGRRDRFDGLRQYEGMSGFPKRSESEFDVFGTGHSSTSISAALGMAVASKLQGNTERWHIAVIGDGALTGGMALEALNDAGAYKDEDGVRLLIILNDNDCSISESAGALSGHLAQIVSSRAYSSARELSKRVLKPVPTLWNCLKRFETQAINLMSPPAGIFSSFDLNYYGPVDGHDLPQLIKVLKNLRGNRSPVVLHVATQKGKGYKLAEDSPTAYHGVGVFDPDVGLCPKKAGRPTYTQIFSRWIEAKAAKDKRLYAITPAMREGSGLVNFEKAFPERYRDVAIAEQHAVTYAAGLACEGIKPVVAIYSTFLQRALDQVIHDVAIQNLPVMLAVDRGGLVGADGATHQGVFDLSMLRTIPNMTVMAPSDEKECYLMLNTAYSLDTPTAVRYPRGAGCGEVVDDTDEVLPVGVSRVIREGKTMAILSFGAMLDVMRPVADALNATLIDMRFIKPIDEEAILKAAASHEVLVTAEEGQLMGGAGSAVLEVLSDALLTVPVVRLGLGDHFIEQGTHDELFAEEHLTSEQVLARLKAQCETLGIRL